MFYPGHCIFVVGRTHSYECNDVLEREVKYRRMGRYGQAWNTYGRTDGQTGQTKGQMDGYRERKEETINQCMNE